MTALRCLPGRMAAVLALAAIPGRAQVQVVLEPPAGMIEPGVPALVRAQVAGAGADPACHWAVAEDGRLLEARDGVRLEEVDGGIRLTVAGGDRDRTLQVRAAARRDPSAFAVVQVRVAAAGAAAAGPGPAEEPPGWQEPDPAPMVWATPFRGAGPVSHAAAWDPAGPGLVALAEDEDGCRVLRLGLDGACERLGGGAGPVFGPFCSSLAVAPDGSVLVADGAGHRIWRLGRDGRAEVVAGTGLTAWTGDRDPEGRPVPALQASLGHPWGLGVTPAGDVVFSDMQHGLIRRFTPGGPIETLAGGGAGPGGLRHDLARRHPATAAALGMVHALALAPDGRILVAEGIGDGHGALLALHPDGTLRRVPLPPGLEPGTLAVTEDNQVIVRHRDLVARIGPDGQVTPVAGVDPLAPFHTARAFDDPAPLARGPGHRLALGWLAAVPGGGVLSVDWRNRRVVHLGPHRTDHLLAERVRAALAAAAAGNPDRAARIRAGLAKWTDAWPPRAGAVRDVLLRSRSGAGVNLPTAPDWQTLPFEYLRPDFAGRGLRARIALHVLDLELAHGAGPAGPQ